LVGENVLRKKKKGEPKKSPLTLRNKTKGRMSPRSLRDKKGKKKKRVPVRKTKNGAHWKAGNQRGKEQNRVNVFFVPVEKKKKRGGNEAPITKKKKREVIGRGPNQLNLTPDSRWQPKRGKGCFGVFWAGQYLNQKKREGLGQGQGGAPCRHRRQADLACEKKGGKPPIQMKTRVGETKSGNGNEKETLLTRLGAHTFFQEPGLGHPKRRLSPRGVTGKMGNFPKKIGKTPEKKKETSIAANFCWGKKKTKKKKKTRGATYTNKKQKKRHKGRGGRKGGPKTSSARNVLKKGPGKNRFFRPP